MPEQVLKFIQRRAYAITCSLLFLAAVIVRILAARGDFAMDEIWSLRLATENAQHITDIIFKIKHDNNHILNSVWMYVLGPQQIWQLYRIPAVIGGSLCVLFSFLIARRQSRAQGIAALILTGFCFPLVFYSSEARGYGPMLGFAMISFYAMTRLIDESNPRVLLRHAILFWSAVVLGLLSHLIFIYIYIGFVTWSLQEFFTQKDKSRIDQAKSFIYVHSVPIIAAIFLYHFFVK
ncbi:MAG TPA: glycosyltransferase family 39 protein, partial [Candidatus Omnitrophota bacterium]|nr:glycosyltransferase family 39 protein [Candidatus Omnitrophota bacterium]